ncbi:hypothetical protein MPNT_210016 [Candidatus Methylacidithermus pantelleriae]|uniref:Uncharacterized protein n=1 Tax=Candidatus Methylacidithermus pantelleriae TaxID=2744239 RepID=A0A8J2FNP0_9BACT|nr:hypothetical protein MPNT_210016 [Candidatus Methylacidithermus pantelleriae]
MSFDAIDVVERRITIVTESHLVEDEELRLGPEVRGVGDACAFQICFGFFLPRRGDRYRKARGRSDPRWCR